MNLQHFQRFQTLYASALLCAYILINNTINATTQIMEAKRAGDLTFLIWEPFVWEYSSALGSLLMFPALIWFLKNTPFNWQKVPASLAMYFGASIIFSMLHIAIMVGSRKLVYLAYGRSYDFGLSWFELIYEYQKDAISFVFFITLIKAYQYVVQQLLGEASSIEESEQQATPTLNRLLVKKRGKEFIVKIDDVDWLESSGNYVNLYIGTSIYPLRTTLTVLSKQLEDKGFCRVHRSHGVNLDRIESITPLPSGDSEIKLTTGKVLNLSRRYKEQFKLKLK
ncbi:LytTR family DNA-binding domain-containing protein [Pseudoalteromonas sp. P1-7a]|uniref:LytR/AlgR family response regulator transcription factor n=1 Tax=Pseudoalteromonas sp. P1-7a TaxID=1723755 RepID=UPI0006D67703|nr:LytTR family DNA-binding domain-containing protein [Pseudoalteromonas sp. P1-7a]KPZ58692.1 putative two-component response-regulatory protein YehT [Pseudoalteromonas sp. P1-7a]